MTFIFKEMTWLISEYIDGFMDNRIVSLSYQNCIAVGILKFNNIKVLSNIDCVSYFKLCKFLIICKQLLKNPTKAAFAI